MVEWETRWRSTALENERLRGLLRRCEPAVCGDIGEWDLVANFYAKSVFGEVCTLLLLASSRFLCEMWLHPLIANDFIFTVSIC